MALSILHRATGIVLAIGTLLLIYWLLAGALGKDAYAGAQAFFSQWFGRLLLFGWSAALFYHLFNGVRHLLWDAGKGFELRTAYASGLVVVAASIATTALAWIAGYAMK
jgi:succinate dehydrogenase / fumarate reductase cytochrome b subunit